MEKFWAEFNEEVQLVKPMSPLYIVHDTYLNCIDGGNRFDIQDLDEAKTPK